jgi:hypothetical protein
VFIVEADLHTDDPEQLAIVLYALVKNLAKKRGVTDADTIQLALIDTWKGSQSYQSNRGKALPYYNRIAVNRFAYEGRKPVRYVTNYNFDNIPDRS